MAESIVVQEILAHFGYEVDDKTAKSWAKSVDNLKDKMGGALKMSAKLAAGVGAVAASLFAATKASASAGDAAAKDARRVGMSTEAYQELRFAAEQSGVKIEEFTMMLAKQNTMLGMVERGDKNVAKTIRDLGLEYKDLKKQSPDEQFASIAEAVKRIEDPTKRAALASRIYGESWSKAASLFDAGAAGIAALRAQAQELGFVVGDDAAKASEEFNDSIARMQLRVTGLRNRIGFALMPVFQKAIHGIEKWWGANKELINQKIEVWAVKLAKAVEEVGLFLEKLPERLERFGGIETILKNAVKFAGILMAVKIAAPFIAAAKAAWPIAVAIKAAGLAGVVVAAKFIAIAALVVAAIAAIYYVVTDIFAFMQGRDSVIGRIVEAVKEWVAQTEKAQGVIGALMRTVQALANFVVAMAGFIWGKVSPILSSIGGGIKSLFEDAIAALTSFWEGTVSPIFAAIFGEWASRVEYVLGTLTTVLNVLTDLFNGGTQGVQLFDQAVAQVFGRIKARVAELVGSFGSVADGLRSIPGLGKLLGPSTQETTSALAPPPGRMSPGGAMAVSIVNGDTTFQINGAGNPSQTAQVINQRQTKREDNTMRTARSAFAGGER